MSFIKFLTVRLVMALASRSWHCPDETWQSVEVSHNIVYGYGYLTWEWSTWVAIRSFLHPLVFVPGLWLLRITGLDHQFLVVLVPRITQALLSALGDHFLLKFYKANFSRDIKYFVLIYTSNFYLLYCSSRTLINTAELAIGNIALYFFSRAINGSGRASTIYVFLISLSFMMRMTTALLWLPLVLWHTYLLYGEKLLMSRMFGMMIPVAILVVGLAAMLDGWLYGQMTFVPWNFFKINVINDISTQYGQEPWHYYVSATLLPVLNFSLPFTLYGLYLFGGIYGVALGLSFGLLTTLKHKEQRFMLPLIPLMACYAAAGLQHATKRLRSSEKSVAIVVAMVNVIPLIYLSLFHQIGSMVIIDELSSRAQPNSTVLHLLPCHHTPYYSHLHKNIKMDFLKCPPQLGRGLKSQLDESDFFFGHPDRWMEQEFGVELKGREREPPSFLTMYDKTSQFPVVVKFLKQNKYKKCGDFFQTLIHNSDRYGDRLHLYCKS